MPTTTAPLAPIWVPVWESAPPVETPPAATGAWIVAGDDAALADEVAARLGASVVSGPSLVRTVSQPAGSIAGVCYLAVARSPESGAGIAEVLALVQALGALIESRQPRLVIVTRGAQAIGPAAGGDGARRAPLWGLARVVRNEYPALRCGCVDLDPLSTDEDCAAAIAAECSTDDEDQVAWRNHERLALRLRAAEAVPEAAAPLPARLVCRTAGNLDSLAFEPAPVRSPRAGEVLVAVRAAGLNCHDVRHALGARELTAESAFGFDAAGVVIDTGAGVESLAAGDRVMVTLTPGSMAHRVVAREHFVTRLPASVTFAEGAGVPLAFLTAWHGLISIAQVKAGERVLIHAATGGVGQAAIQVARARGAVVFATASAPKQRLLKEQGIEWIFDSRTPDFSAAVLAATGGRGVEVVLNCLTGDMIRAGLDCTAKGGRFVEIGPTGGWPAAQVAAHRPDLRYSPFDLAEVARAEPGYIKHLLDCIADGLVAGTLRPIRTLAFRAAAASEAFRLVSRARHVGKVAIVMPRAAEPLHEGVHLVTGGFGALGRSLSAHLREAGVRRLALVARAEPDDERREFLASLQRDGVDARAFVADLADAAQVADLLGRIGADFAAPITAIYHTAGELADGIIAEQTPASFARVAGAKLTGAWNLHRHTRGLDLDRFVLFSSAAALIGTPGQSNYAAANAGLDALAAHRRSEGLPALSVNWGPWDGSGAAARLRDADRARMAAAGVGMLEDGPAWRAMLALIARGDAQAMVMPVDWSRFNARFDGKYVPSLFRGVRGQAAVQNGPAPGAHIVRAIADLASEQRQPALHRYLPVRVAAPLGRPEPAEIRSPVPASVVADEPAELPLSHGQSTLYYRHQLQPGSPAHNIAFAVRVRSVVDEPALRARVGALVERHAQLRRVYRETDAGLRQVLAPARDVFSVFDVAGATEQELRQRVADDDRAPFDLASGPLIRVSLFSRAAGDHVMLFTVHHIAADAWSLWRMMEELRAGDDLAAPVYRYADKLTDEAAFLQSPAAAAAWAYWNDELAGELPVLNLPTDKPRPAVQTLAGSSVPFSLDVHESERLQALARQTGTTLYTLLLAAFQTLLYRYTNQDDILVGCPLASRNQAASASTVGYFVNPVVVRSRIEPDEPFDALLSDTRRRLLNAIAHQDLPFPLVAERFGGARDPGRSPIFQAAFVMQQLQQDAAGFAALMAPADPPVQIEWGGMRLEHYLLPQQEGQFDLTLEMVHAHGACHGLLKYNSDLWEASTIERMAAHFRTLLHSIADAPTKRVSRLPMVTEDAERTLARLAHPSPVATVTVDARATGEIPLLPMQHWFFGNGGAGTARFNQAVALGPDTTLQVEPLRRALDDLVSRHEALRLRFPAAADGRRSAILVSAAEAAVHFGHWDRPFDVEAGPMMAAELVADGAAPRLVLTAHHLIVDGVSWRTLVGDLEIAYRARAAGRAPAFADEAPSYVAWARALVAFAATAAADAEAIHWLTEDWRRPEAWPLAAAPVEATPAGAGELVFELPAEPLSGQEMEAVLLATLAGVLEPDAREPVLRVDLEGHGRAPLAGADGSAVVGGCAALFPALLRIEGESSSARGASVARTLAEIPAGGRAFGLARYLSPRPRLRHALASVPPASILFNYLGRLDGVLSPSSMFRVERPDGQALRDEHLAPLYPLEVNALVQDGALRVSMRFDRARVFAPWLQALAARWRSALADAATEAYPLTPMQKGILFHALLEPETGVYVQQLVATFDGSVDERWWRAAWDTVLDRHPVLRNAFEWKGLDQPMQQPVARVTMPWVTIDARGADRRAFDAALASFLDEDRQQGFDLTMAPLHRVRMFLRDGGGTLVWTHHHILLDGRSMFQVLHEVLDTMRRYASGHPLPAATGLFRPFAAASSAAGEPSAIDYWREQLQGFEAPTPIPFLDHSHEGAGRHFGNVARTLSAAEADAVRRLARDAGVTLNLLTQSLLALLLSRWSGQDRVMFGATVSAHPDGNTVGLYINTIPVVVPVPVTAPVREWLADCRKRQAERSPFEQMGLVDVQRCSRIAAGRPMFDLLFVFENYGIDAALRKPAGGVSLRTVRVEERTSLPLVLSVWPGEAIELRLRHDSARYPREAAEQLVDSLAGVLRAAVQAGLDTPLKTLTPLDAAMRRVLA